MDPIWCTVYSCGSCEIDDCALGGTIAGGVLLSDESVDTGNIDDPTSISVGMRLLPDHLR